MCVWYVRPISSMRKRMHVTLNLQSHAQLSSLIQSYDRSKESLQES